jgi:hypothetical protein
MVKHKQLLRAFNVTQQQPQYTTPSVPPGGAQPLPPGRSGQPQQGQPQQGQGGPQGPGQGPGSQQLSGEAPELDPEQAQRITSWFTAMNALSKSQRAQLGATAETMTAVLGLKAGDGGAPAPGGGRPCTEQH